jgi:hypothetical protein
MKEQLQQTIELLRQHVLKNIELIKVNELHIKEVLTWPVSADRTRELNDSYSFSKNLLSENNDFINLQVSVMNFITRYNKVFESEQPVKVDVCAAPNHQAKLSRDDYFKLTVEKDMEFNQMHPYFNDSDFYNDLLVFFQENENYEKCAELIKFKQI